MGRFSLKQSIAVTLLVVAGLPCTVAPAAQGDDALQMALTTQSASVQHGYQLIIKTGTLLPQHVGNGLVCANCHLDGGTRNHAAPLTGLDGAFPRYSARKGAVIDLPDRINECLQRSLNGTPLARNDAAMQDIVAYINWLSTAAPFPHNQRGIGQIANLQPDARQGHSLFAARCAACHRENGQGTRTDQTFTVPPLWGPDSFNDGAGMAQTRRAAAFVRFNMPRGQEGTLTDQQALDVAAFISQQSRPVFAGKAADWPHGGRPEDARE